MFQIIYDLAVFIVAQLFFIFAFPVVIRILFSMSIIYLQKRSEESNQMLAFWFVLEYLEGSFWEPYGSLMKCYRHYDSANVSPLTKLLLGGGEFYLLSLRKTINMHKENSFYLFVVFGPFMRIY